MSEYPAVRERKSFWWKRLAARRASPLRRPRQNHEPRHWRANCTMNDWSSFKSTGDSVKTTDVASKSQFRSVDDPKARFDGQSVKFERQRSHIATRPPCAVPGAIHDGLVMTLIGKGNEAVRLPARCVSKPAKPLCLIGFGCDLEGRQSQAGMPHTSPVGLSRTLDRRSSSALQA